MNDGRQQMSPDTPLEEVMHTPGNAGGKGSAKPRLPTAGRGRASNGFGSAEEQIMIKDLVRRNIDKYLDSPRARNLLRKSLLVARTSLDWLWHPSLDPSYDFSQDRSLYPLFAARLTQIVRELDTHPHYAWGSLQGISLAKTLGLDRVSVIEFGVAGGKGLIALEKISLKLEQMYGVAIDVYGFDAGAGLPKARDSRDLPNLWSEGYYAMDQDRLRGYLQKAQLIIGDVEATLSEFVRSKPSPVAFIAFDLDLYSSTAAALRILEADASMLLPRVHCYFDDIIAFTAGEHNGERLAIHEFNQSHQMRKVSHTYGLRYFIPEPFAREMWVEMIFLAHVFDHPLYGQNDGLVRGSAALNPTDSGRSWARTSR